MLERLSQSQALVAPGRSVPLPQGRGPRHGGCGQGEGPDRPGSCLVLQPECAASRTAPRAAPFNTRGARGPRDAGLCPNLGPQAPLLMRQLTHLTEPLSLYGRYPTFRSSKCALSAPSHLGGLPACVSEAPSTSLPPGSTLFDRRSLFKEKQSGALPLGPVGAGPPEHRTPTAPTAPPCVLFLSLRGRGGDRGGRVTGTERWHRTRCPPPPHPQ